MLPDKILACLFRNPLSLSLLLNKTINIINRIVAFKRLCESRQEQTTSVVRSSEDLLLICSYFERFASGVSSFTPKHNYNEQNLICGAHSFEK